ncbi:uncharacterized protein EI97DRAFT_213768 [Westerdykella ornata]|uniref:Uncharacterized protein n=1 Tax=Westerdykella ornata TaxID=318751 RepID=A0A6A6J8B4_WESOR|nr:uncharacterized protein EI97DRAFT_213768 [Westerdykella ornata]KAF2272403.1 hypothetical protein EI97DRAFT_213768 [Westerdykella ornata]
MPSTPSTTPFQPPPPIRTSTVASQSSSSDAMSPGSGTFSPAYPPHGRATVASPTETKFFDAIVSCVRGHSRSRSRSRNGRHSRSRSRSPMLNAPPEQLTSSPSKSSTSTQGAGVRKPQLQSRHASAGSHGSIPAAARPRKSESPLPRRTSSDMWRGRHSNEWLFGGWSVRETARDIVRRKS